MSSAPIDGRAVNKADLANVFAVSLPTIDGWVDKGCPYVEHGGRGREYVFDTAAVVDWRIQRAVKDAVASSSDLASGEVKKEEADRRRAVANAITAEIGADEALNQVVSRHDAEASISAFCQVLKTGLSNAASKIAGRATTITSAPEIETMAHAELNRAFVAARSELELRWAGGRKLPDDGEPEDQSPP